MLGLRTRRHIGTHTFFDHQNGKRVRLAVYVNGEALAFAMAKRAMESRTNRATYGDGAVLVEVIEDGK